MSINVWTFSGRVGRDAEVRTTRSDKDVLGFPVAVDVGWGDNKQTYWVDCSLWGDRAGKLAPHVTKGSAVTVTGEAGMRTYEKDGQTVPVLTCRVFDVALQGGKPAQQQERQAPAREAPARRAPPTDGFEDDDLPF